MEPEQAGIDRVLRQSLGAPAPCLPADFEKRLMREVEKESPARARYKRALLAGYGVVSAVTCAGVMRSQGMDWGATALLTLGPLAAAAVLPLMRRATQLTARRSVK